MSFDDPLFDEMAAEIRRLKTENAILKGSLIALTAATDAATTQLRRIADGIR